MARIPTECLMEYPVWKRVHESEGDWDRSNWPYFISMLWRDGYSMKQISETFAITFEGVRQALLRHEDKLAKLQRRNHTLRVGTFISDPLEDCEISE